MKPYYQRDGVTIYHGDCMEVMLDIDGIDCAITSPPYNKGKTARFTDQCVWPAAQLKEGYLSHSDDLDWGEYADWQRAVVALMWGTLTRRGSIFYNHKQTHDNGRLRLPMEYFPPQVTIRQIITWDRGSGMNWTPTHFKPTSEWVVDAARAACKLADRGASDVGDVWRFPPEHGNPHPAPFPVTLPSRIIKAMAPRSVLDPFCGSGTVLVAAKAAGIKGVGIEIEERYCEIAAKRLRQSVLF